MKVMFSNAFSGSRVVNITVTVILNIILVFLFSTKLFILYYYPTKPIIKISTFFLPPIKVLLNIKEKVAV